jgi:hypothetical protein
MKKRLNELEQELTNIKIESDLGNMNLEQEILMKEQMQSLTDGNSKMKKIIIELQKENKQLQSQTSNIDVKHKESTELLKKEKLKMEESIAALERQMKTQEKDIDRRDLVIKDLKNQLNRLLTKGKS